MSTALRDARSPALASSTASALAAPAPVSLCQRLRDDPVSLIPGTSQLPAFRLIYRLPQLHADHGHMVAARVFATWIFGDLATASHPYTLPRRTATEGFGDLFGYRPYRVPWRVVADSPTLRTTMSGLVATLDSLIAQQVERRLLNEPPAGPRLIDAYAARAWSQLRKRFLAPREGGKAAQIATGWLPLPSSGLQFYADVLANGQGSDGEPKPTESAMVFGGANLYPLIEGHIEGPDTSKAWTLSVDQWRPVLVDRFSFDDDHSAPLQFIYGLTMAALRGIPGVLEYPSNLISQPLGLWDPQGHLRLKGTPERPLIELLNRSFTDFALQVATPLAALRQKLQCTLVSPMQCKAFDLIAIGEPQPLADRKFKVGG